MKKGFTLFEILITLGVIAVVVAVTIPTSIKKYQQKTTVESLKVTYSILNQVVNMSIVENGSVDGWDFTQDAQSFFEMYIMPYIKNIKLKNSNASYGSHLSWSNDYSLTNGTYIKFYLVSPSNFGTNPNHVMIKVDINGNKKPNILGKDQFAYFIFPVQSSFYNNGFGNCAKNVPRGGLYPDGYGYDRNVLVNDDWRGCAQHNNSLAALSTVGQYHGMVGTYCTSLIMLDGWKISKDYNW